MEIRETGADDLDLLVDLRLQFLGERTGVAPDAELVDGTRAYLHGRLDAGAYRAWVAEHEGEAVGVVSIVLFDVPPRPGEPRTRDAYVINMFVRPEHRSRGLGRRLVGSAVAAAQERHVRKVLLHATEHGRPLYESLGFEPNEEWMELPLPRR